MLLLFMVIFLQTTEDCFNMDYRYPLSLLQAFAICIARYVLTQPLMIARALLYSDSREVTHIVCHLLITISSWFLSLC
jgi:hypothetical protein